MLSRPSCQELTGCFALELKAFKEAAASTARRGRKASIDPDPAEPLVERVQKTIWLTQQDGARKERSLRQCSGGEAARRAYMLSLFAGSQCQPTGAYCRGLLLSPILAGERRRIALALTLGYRDLVAERAGLRCNLLVLDEAGRQGLAPLAWPPVSARILLAGDAAAGSGGHPAGVQGPPGGPAGPDGAAGLPGRLPAHAVL